MKLAIFATLASCVAAFAPRNVAKAPTSALHMSFEAELGAQPPLGFFDPLGLVADGNQKNFDRLRFVEVKHGRVAMLACAGHITTAAGIRLPGNIDLEGTTFESIPTGFDALSKIPGGGLTQLFAFIGLLEIFVMKDVVGGEFPGDFRNGFDFGWEKFDSETKLQKRAIELNNGRAGMMGILALMVHEKLGDAYVINSLFGAGKVEL